ncbi:MAG: DUF1178 family protein, partial [Pseudomonadota bacterium]
MIRYDLLCANGHRFDAWFRNSGDFDNQAEAGLLDCPTCADTRVTKALMTPGVRTARGRAEAVEEDTAEASAPRPVPKPPVPVPAMPPEVMQAAARVAAMRQMAAALHRHVTETAENVGKGFAKEA